MTVEIRELVIQVEVTETSAQAAASSPAGYTEWDEQRLLEKLKREVLEYLQERGQL
ncbi:hypothetical protein EDF81_0782 [Enterobacter sp. BIGb0383]|uniref:DUF5908 family protein n=1 Tax=unclassified Enterobacter TaxID=2608935 RepID=UPI000FB86A89|nr:MULTISPECIES: DUF5908 family protein [unclassified Enterobacter]ROP62297.1 hypothetical protein EDF81_0782 [Enterobacter sp. BIGb0383]ROS12458.1 hypothetical protein EC848_0784 [Enterobacter sp. BIGb0359]